MTASVQGETLYSAIAEGVLRITHQYTNRRPTSAEVTIGENIVVCVVHCALTLAERKLADLGMREAVVESRRHYQTAMSADLTALVQQHTGRMVIAFMSDNTTDPDLGAEIFVLEPVHV